MSSRLPTSRFRRSASSSTVARAARAALRRRAAPRSTQQAARGAGDRGERRAQVVRHRAQAARCAGARSRPRPAPARRSAASCARSSASAVWLRERLEQLQLVGRAAAAARRASRTPSTPSAPSLPVQRQVERAARPGSVSVPRPAGCRWSNAHCATPSSCGVAREQRARSPAAAARGRPTGLGQQHGRLAFEHARPTCARRDLRAISCGVARCRPARGSSA